MNNLSREVDSVRGAPVGSCPTGVTAETLSANRARRGSPTPPEQPTAGLPSASWTGSKAYEVSIRGWASPLAISVTALLLIQAVTGLWIYLAPFSVGSQLQVLLHVTAGIVSIVPYLCYQLRHWLVWRRQKMTAEMVLGYLLMGMVLACIASGLWLAWQAALGPRISRTWDLVHLVSGLGALVLEGMPLDGRGQLIRQHELWEKAGGKGKRVIFPNYSDSQLYVFQVPADAVGPLTVKADLNYRRYRQEFLDLMLPELVADKSVQQPLVAQASAEKRIAVGGVATGDRPAAEDDATLAGNP